MSCVILLKQMTIRRNIWNGRVRNSVSTRTRFSAVQTCRILRFPRKFVRICGYRTRRPVIWQPQVLRFCLTCPLRMKSSAKRHTAAIWYACSPAAVCAVIFTVMQVRANPLPILSLPDTMSLRKMVRCWLSLPGLPPV